MSESSINLIDVGQLAWPRWMIVHRERKRYWSKGTWKKRRRNGELWCNRTEAERELHIARSKSQA